MYASVFFHLCSFDSLRFASPRLALSCLSFLFVFSFRLSGIFFPSLILLIQGPTSQVAQRPTLDYVCVFFFFFCSLASQIPPQISKAEEYVCI